MADIEWLTELFSEYPVKTKDGRAIRTPEQVRRMRRIFEHIPQPVMLDAVYRYMRVGHYFPKPADLWTHVKAAQEDNRGDVAYSAEGDNFVIRYGRWPSRHSVRVTDDELHQMELARDGYA